MSYKITQNFSLSEFRCKDGTDVPEELMDNVSLLCENLQVLRDEIGKPIRVISGYRSPKYNRRIGGARRSQHMTANAADIKVRTNKAASASHAASAEASASATKATHYATLIPLDVAGMLRPDESLVLS